ncbi:50S ribosomal protein L11 methyltransferase [Acuticoccus kandeliae]|uniref:50S ribosomal protein L11 methyltransferase n=1 Tax=Acuticoccus kandeliae TaxID=2073160 RepID=UPI000D3E288B|nr:50S ribosomal protein L11 methyltransferase [Acuticoccus kandeliae]
MVTRAFCTLGVGDAFQKPALAALTTLDALVDEGEPIVSVYRSEQDGPWLIDVLFQEADESAQTRFLEAARSLLPDLPPFEFDSLAERDWVAESQRQLHPVDAGRFVIYGSHDSAKLPPSRWRIEIDAGRAFGTAHHASTKGCLIALERVANRGPLGSMMDVGTGSGVLAIAADRLGASAVKAGDIDPIAVRVAQRNVEANRCRLPIRVVVAAGPFAEADTVVANILARPLIAMAPRLAASARRNLILSGLRTTDARRVRAAYLNRGFRLVGRVLIEDWVTLILERRASPVTAMRGLQAESLRTPFVTED